MLVKGEVTFKNKGSLGIYLQKKWCFLCFNKFSDRTARKKKFLVICDSIIDVNKIIDCVVIIRRKLYLIIWTQHYFLFLLKLKTEQLSDHFEENNLFERCRYSIQEQGQGKVKVKIQLQGQVQGQGHGRGHGQGKNQAK